MTHRQIAKYQLIEPIGQGGFGDVYLAEDTVLGSTVALKVLAPAYMRDPSVVKRFQQEARAAARLRHPHIVRIYDLGQDEGVLYLAMDYLPGRTLAEIIRDEGPLPVDRVADLLTQIASALDHAHGRGLIHRDVKPGNVIVGDDGHATLMDFGLVKAADDTPFTILHRTAGSEQFTTGGGTIGTPEYMAPEQADSSLGEVGPRTDLYALGVVAYQMLTGRVPFHAGTPVATLRAHADLPPPLLSQWADLPDEMAAAVLQALAKQPDERWPSAGAFAEALAGAVARGQAVDAQDARLADLYGQARQALADRQWAQALGLCGQIMAQAPTYRQVGELFEEANAGLSHQREWEARQAELGALYEQAVEYMAAEEWDEAILLLLRIVDVGQEHVFRDAPHKLIEAKAARERAEEERRARIEVVSEEWLATLDRALALLSEWRALEPDNERVAVTGDALSSLEKEWLHPAPPEPEVVELAAEADAKSGPAASIEVVELEPPSGLTEIQLQPWERLPFEPEMVYVPAGEFLMGSADDDPNASKDEKPQRRVYLDAYYIGRYPVTNAQYKAFVDETGHRPPTHWQKGLFQKRIEFPEEERQHPVVEVSWEDAVAYCRWLSQKTGRPCRLPTEAEWEKAARGSNGRTYPWGNRWNRKKCNLSQGGKGGTKPVGAYSPAGDSPWGCADMAGNVWEWVNDWYDGGYYTHSPANNPRGPDSGDDKVLRGGSWYDGPDRVRAAYRDYDDPTFRYDHVGFRCVAGLPGG